MTENPLAAAPVPPHRRGRRVAGIAVRVAAWAAGSAIAIGSILAGLTPAAASGTITASSTAAASSTVTPSPTPTVATDPELVASPSAAGVVPTGQDPVFSVRLTNETARAVPASAVVVALSRSPLTSSAAVTAWLDDGTDDSDADTDDPTAGAVFDEVARADFAELASDDQRTVNVSVPAEAAAITALTPGVYPVTVSLAGEVERTVITVPQTDAPARAVGVVVPITAGPLTTGLLSREQLEEATGEQGRLSALLDGVAGTSAILAVDPAVVASIRVLGSSAPDSANAWLDNLLALPNERFALQFGDADLAVQVQAGLAAPLTPTTLAPFADPNDFPAGDDTQTDDDSSDDSSNDSGTGSGGGDDAQSGAGSGGAGSETGGDAGTDDDAAATGVPDLAALTDIGDTGPALLWPASGTASGDVIAALDAQVDPGAVLVPSTTVTDAATAVRGVAGDADLFVYDAAISSALADAAEREDTTERGSALAAASAHLQLRGDTPLLAVVDRPEEAGRVALRAAITAMTASPGATPLTLGDLQSAAPTPTSVVEVEASAARVDALTGFLASESTLSQFATVLVDPQQLTSRERASILQIMGNAWSADPDAWTAAVDAHEQQTIETLGAVAIVNPGNINFLATSAPISVTVRNDLRWPIAVRLEARTGDPRLIVQHSTQVEAGADQNTRVDVPVEARVGSGDTALQLQLWSTSGIAIGPEETIELTVRAEWESVGITVTVVLVVGLIAAGVVRTVVKLRQRRRGPDATDATGADAAGTTERTEPNV